MKFAASTILPGDIVQGVGLKVDNVDAISDVSTRLYGTVSTRIGTLPDGAPEFRESVAMVEVPNDHRLRVRRSDENFRADRIRLVEEAIDKAYSETEDDGVDATDLLVDRLYRVGTMPKGRRYQLNPESVRDMVAGLLDGTETGADVVDALDALDVPEEGEDELDGEIIGGFGLVIFPAPTHTVN